MPYCEADLPEHDEDEDDDTVGTPVSSGVVFWAMMVNDVLCLFEPGALAIATAGMPSTEVNMASNFPVAWF